MKRTLAGVVGSLLLLAGLSACGAPEFCEASQEIAGDVDVQDTAATLAALEDLRGEAPEELQADLDTAIEQLRLIEEGDIASADAMAIIDAGENLSAWESENC